VKCWTKRSKVYLDPPGWVLGVGTHILTIVEAQMSQNPSNGEGIEPKGQRR